MEISGHHVYFHVLSLADQQCIIMRAFHKHCTNAHLRINYIAICYSYPIYYTFVNIVINYIIHCWFMPIKSYLILYLLLLCVFSCWEWSGFITHLQDYVKLYQWLSNTDGSHSDWLCEKNPYLADPLTIKFTTSWDLCILH